MFRTRESRLDPSLLPEDKDDKIGTRLSFDVKEKEKPLNKRSKQGCPPSCFLFLFLTRTPRYHLLEGRFEGYLRFSL